MFKKRGILSAKQLYCRAINKNVKPALKDTAVKTANNNTIDFSMQRFFGGSGTHQLHWKIKLPDNIIVN